MLLEYFLLCVITLVSRSNVTSSNTDLSHYTWENYLCRSFSQCESLSVRVCRLLSNGSDIIIARQDEKTPGSCECCVRKDQNPLVMRNLWLGGMRRIHEQSITAQAMVTQAAITNPSISTSTTLIAATSEPSTTLSPTTTAEAIKTPTESLIAPQITTQAIDTSRGSSEASTVESRNPTSTESMDPGNNPEVKPEIEDAKLFKAKTDGTESSETGTQVGSESSGNITETLHDS